MKKIVLKALQRYLICVVMVALLIPAWSCASGQEDSKLKSSIETINGKFADAFRSGSADNLSAYYMADAQLMPPGMPPISGRDQILSFWQGAMNSGVGNVRLQTSAVSGSGNEVIEYGIYTIFAGDNFAVDKGKYIVIWKKEGKDWKIFRDIWNSDNPPPIARSVLNDTILILYNYIKADKVEDFKKFNNEFLHPLFLKENNAATRSARMLEPMRANQDGTYTYIYLMDPAVNTPGAYAFLPPLTREYGEEKAREIIKEGFTDALAQPQKSQLFVVRLMGQ
jgi:ketosteroid isomerase-like protein